LERKSILKSDQPEGGSAEGCRDGERDERGARRWREIEIAGSKERNEG